MIHATLDGVGVPVVPVGVSRTAGRSGRIAELTAAFEGYRPAVAEHIARQSKDVARATLAQALALLRQRYPEMDLGALRDELDAEDDDEATRKVGEVFPAASDFVRSLDFGDVP
jgi:hypothetical protein